MSGDADPQRPSVVLSNVFVDGNSPPCGVLDDGIADDIARRFVFCSFEEALGMDRSGLPDIALPWNPLNLSMNDIRKTETHLAYACCAYRIAYTHLVLECHQYAMTLARVFTRDESALVASLEDYYTDRGWWGRYAPRVSQYHVLGQKLAFYTHLHMCSHFNLICYMECMGVYDDQTLAESSKAMWQFYPDPDIVLHAGELPMVSQKLFCCNHWGNVKQSTDPITFILDCAVDQKNRTKKMRENVIDNWKRSPEFYDFTIQLVACSLIGLYEHCTVRPLFHTAKRLWMSLVHTHPKIEYMSVWFTQARQDIMLYVFKEFYGYCMQFVPGLAAVLQAKYELHAVRGVVRRAMDRFRLDMERDNQAFSNDIFSTGVGVLTTVWNQMLKMFYRPQVEVVEHYVMTELMKYEEANGIESIRTDGRVLTEEWRDVIMKLIARTSPGASDQWKSILEIVCVAQPVIDEIERIAGLLREGVSEPSVTRLVDTMYLYDFVVVRDVLKFLDDRSRFYMIPLPVDMFRAQLAAARKKTGTPFDQPMPAGVQQTKYCRECAKPLEAVVAGTTRDWKMSFNCGIDGAEVDPFTGDVYCMKQVKKAVKKSNVVRKPIQRFGLIPKDPFASVRAVRPQKPAGGGHRAITIYTQGYLLIDRAAKEPMLVNCCACHSLTPFSTHKFVGGTFCCMGCISSPENTKHVTCDVCMNEVEMKKSKLRTAYDDVTSKEMREVRICTKCHSKFWVRYNFQNITLSKIREGVKQKWMTQTVAGVSMTKTSMVTKAAVTIAKRKLSSKVIRTLTYAGADANPYPWEHVTSYNARVSSAECFADKILDPSVLLADWDFGIQTVRKKRRVISV